MDLQAIYIRSHQARTSPDKHVAYAVEIHTRSRNWTIWRRYSDFETLVAELQKEQHTSSSRTTYRLPALPPKRAGSVILTPWKALGLGETKAEHEGFIKDRQAGLERFLKSLVADKDAEGHRESVPFRTFLAVPAPSTGNSVNKHLTAMGDSKEGKGGNSTDFTTQSWMDEHDLLLALSREIQALLAKRDTLLDRGDSTSSHTTNVEAKKALSNLIGRTSVLAKGLEEISTRRGGISEGELRRRMDMLAKLQDGTEQLGKLANGTSTSATSMRGTRGGQMPATSASRDALLGNGGGKPVTRVLGAAAKKQPVEETAQTRVLDNAGLLQMQMQEMDDQDDRVTSLTSVLRRQREIATAIGVELEQQNELLNDLSTGVDRTGAKLAGAKKQLRRLEK